MNVDFIPSFIQEWNFDLSLHDSESTFHSGSSVQSRVPGNLAPPKYGPPFRKFGPPLQTWMLNNFVCVQCIVNVSILWLIYYSTHVCEYTNNLHKDIVYKATNDQHKKHKRLEALNRPSDPVNTFEERYRKHKIFYYVQTKTIWHLNFAI